MTRTATVIEDAMYLRMASAGLFCLSICFAGDWPDWRGPNRDGVSTETGWLAPWPPQGPPILWRQSLGNGYTTVTIVGDKLFTMGNQRINGSETDLVYCLNPETGEEIWKYSYPCRRGHFEGTRMVPIPDGDRVYTLSREGNLFCLNVDDGSVKWSKDLHREYGLNSHRHGMSCHPLVVDEKLILEIGGSDASVIAINKTTGQEIWRSGKDKLGYSSPILYREKGERRMAIFTGSALLGMNPDNGDIFWRTPWEPEFQVSVATPIFKDNRVFVSSGYGPGCAVYEFNDRSVKTVWRSEVIINHYNACVRVGDYLYGFDGGYTSRARTQFLKCIEFDTGKEIWQQSGMGKGALMVADGKLIILSETGKLIIAKASPAGYEELQSVQLLQRKCWTMPVLSNGRIYCRDEAGNMVCVGVNEHYVNTGPTLVTRTYEKVSIPAKPSVSEPAPAPVAPIEEIELSNVWPGSDKGLVFSLADAEDAKNVERLSLNGDAKLGDRALSLNGGRVLVAGLSRSLLDSCRKTNELTLEVVVQTDNLSQKGPARIVSFSLDAYKRNFTICQTDSNLILRLRTTSTGENGMKPEVTLGPVSKGKAIHLLVSYRPGELDCYINGKAQNVAQIDGDFSNWEEHQLVLGNEWKDDRAWIGEIHHVAINSRAVSAKEAFARFLLSQDLELPADLKKPSSLAPKPTARPAEPEPPKSVEAPTPAVKPEVESNPVIEVSRIQTERTEWLIPDCRYRLLMRVQNTSGLEVVASKVDFAGLLRQGGGEGSFDLNSVRIVEVTSNHAIRRVSHQLNAGEKGADELILWLQRASTAKTSDFHLYFDTTESELHLPATTAWVSVTEGVQHQNEDVIKVSTGVAMYYYSSKGGSFSSIIDRDGRDWISYRPTGGAAGSHRGIPNLPFPEGFFHPGGKDCETKILSRGPLHASLRSESKDGKWACVWNIYPTFAELTVMKGSHPYWLLYEGTPGGSLGDEDLCIRSTGETTSIYQSWKGDLPGAEWVCFVDKNLGRGLFLANHQDDNAIDSYWPMQRKMTVFGFGREDLKSYMTAFPARFTLRLTEAVTFKSLSAHMAAIASDAMTELSATEKRP
ncbi:MAG: PQQ-binding-like beta-propeller repeat protein [Planctomycetota bacterium]|nr:PQQ-binding-like beta-propeller repeat protein [Planctomycetota bacterium]